MCCDPRKVSKGPERSRKVPNPFAYNCKKGVFLPIPPTGYFIITVLLILFCLVATCSFILNNNKFLIILQQLGLFLDIRTPPIITCMHRDSKCYAIIQCKSMITIEYKNNSVPILRAGQLGALVKYTTRLEGNKLVSNRTNLIRTSKKTLL